MAGRIEEMLDLMPAERDGGSAAAYWYGDLQYLQEGWAQS